MLVMIGLILLDGIFDRSLEPHRQPPKDYQAGSGLPKSGTGGLPNQVPPSTGIPPVSGPPVVIRIPGNPGLTWIQQPDGSFTPSPRYDNPYRLENSTSASKYEPRYEYPLHRQPAGGQDLAWYTYPFWVPQKFIISGLAQ